MPSLHSSSRQALKLILNTSPPWFSGILNITPDSFSDGGSFYNPHKALEHAKQLIAEGANILDIGGESTGPQSKEVCAEEEWQRIKPLIDRENPQFTISVDTYRASTAERCLKLGARIINDVSALRADPAMARVVAQHKAFIVLMYSKETGAHPHATMESREYGDVIAEVISFFERQIDFALAQGISEQQIILDPGMGMFVSPNPAYSWQILRQLGDIRQRFPSFALMVGTSRKSFLGGEIKDRQQASQETAWTAYKNGADILRVHEVAATLDFFRKKQEYE